MQHSNQNLPQAVSTIEPMDGASMDALSKEKHARRFQRGLKWLGAGACILVLSFALNVLIFHSGGDMSGPMYVLTTIGSLGCLKGMMDIF